MTTLGEYYADNGAESAAKYLSALFAIDIPCYASIDYDTMNTLISNFGSLPVDLPMAISYLDTDSEQTDYASDIDYEKGDLALTGKADVYKRQVYDGPNDFIFTADHRKSHTHYDDAAQTAAGQIDPL